MKRKVSIVMLLAGLAGWGSPAFAGNYMAGSRGSPTTDGPSWGARVAPEAEGFVGPYGQPVPVRAPAREPTAADFAQMALARSLPSDVVRLAYQQGGVSPFVLTSGIGHGPTVPGPVPPGGMGSPPGAVAAVGAIGPGMSAPYSAFRTEIRFVGPAGMRIAWYAPRPDGRAGFTSQYLEAPARYNFGQASIYRLKLSDIPNRPGVELYPTLEVLPATAKTATFLAHAAVPVNFTEEDFEQVAAGNFLVKVVYLPDPQFQDLAATGPDEVVSSRLEPGVDPIIEAKRRGSILAIVRLGNIDLEAPNTPAMDAPPPGYGQAPAMNAMPMPPGMLPGMPMRLGMPRPVPPPVPNGPPIAAPGAPPPVPPPTMPPVSRLPAPSTVQPTASAQPAPAPPAPPSTPRQSSWRTGLADLLGKPTTQR